MAHPPAVTVAPHPRPVVAAATELRWAGATWCVVGATGLAVGLMAGSVGSFSPLEVSGTVLVFGLSVAAALGTVVLGRRATPAAWYWQVFELAFPPPPHIRLESSRATATRAVIAAVATGLWLAFVAAIVLALALLLMGKPGAEIPDHLAAAAELVASGWTLIAGAVALRVAAWFVQWERRHGRRVMCRPLRSGTMLQVYYVSER